MEEEKSSTFKNACDIVKKSRLDEEDKIKFENTIKDCPSVLIETRGKEEHGKYEGQTVLHIVICRESEECINLVFNQLSADTNGKKLLRQPATGTEFRKSVMLAELPLGVAALTLNSEVFKTVLRRGQSVMKNEFKDWLKERNSKGDNIFHCLIKYCHLYPEKVAKVMAMFWTLLEILSAELSQDELDKMITVKNVDDYTPLRLSGYLGQVDLFQAILEQEVYCKRKSEDALFDIKVYNVDELDTIHEVPVDNTKGATKLVSNPISVLTVIHDLQSTSASQLVGSGPISRLITEKWERYRWIFYPWFCLHFVFMCLLSNYCALRSGKRNEARLPEICPDPVDDSLYGLIFSYVNVVVAVIYLALCIVRIVKNRSHISSSKLSALKSLRDSLTSPYGNGRFQVLFVLMSVFLIIDTVMAYNVDCYENYMLICPEIFGWFLILFFLRCWQRFSFFTVLLQNVIINEMFSFSVIFIVELAAFGTAMHMVIQGSPVAEDANYSNYWRVMVTMISRAIGGEDLSDLFSTKYPVLTLVVFAAFVVMTILLLINALIAVLSQTATELMDPEGSHAKLFLLQRLSIILYMESIIPLRWCKMANRVSMESLRSPGSTAKDASADMIEVKPTPKEEKPHHEPAKIPHLNKTVQTVEQAKRKHPPVCQLDIYNMQLVEDIKLRRMPDVAYTP